MAKKDCKFIKKDGKWRIDARIYFGDGTFAHCNKRWFSSKAEAKEYYQEWETKKFGEHEMDSDMPFEKFYDKWEEKRLQEVRDTTFITCDRPVINSLFKKFFFKKTVREAFDPNNIESLYSHVRNSGLGVSRKNMYVNLVLNVIEYAYMLMLINDRQHQMAVVRLQKFRKEDNRPSNEKSRTPWSEEELNAFLATFEEGSFERIMFEFFCHSGMRLGEFLALKPKDIDFQNRLISVSHQLTYKGRGKAIDTALLKSQASYRRMVMLESDAKAVFGLIEQRGVEDDEYIFPCARSSFRRLWNNACKKAGVRHAVPHSIRHMLAVKLLGNCKSISDQIAVAKMLGHTPSVDIDTYANHENIGKALSIYTA